MEIWNGYKVRTVEAHDVQFILCEHTKKNVNEPSRTFKLPPKIFHVTVKFPIGTSNKFLNLEKSRILMFPVNNDLATTGHKLQKVSYSFINQLQYCKLDLCCFVQSDKLRWSFSYAAIKTKFQP